MNRTANSRSAFTLVELLVVIAIIGVLVALLLPAVQAAREAARRSQCQNNLKQMGLALQMYHDTYEVFPSASGGGGTGWSWSARILPYFEQSNVRDLIDFSVAYNVYDPNASNNDNEDVHPRLSVPLGTTQRIGPLLHRNPRRGRCRRDQLFCHCDPPQ